MKTMMMAMGLLMAAAAADAATYEIDPDHSSVEFKVRHLVGKVRGRFEKFTGSYEFDAKDPKTAKAEGSVDAASIDTNTEARDKHLRSAEFFDVEKCPKLTFKSTKSYLNKDGKGKLNGDLTIHCVTKPVSFDVEVSGEGKDPWGNVRTAVSGTAKVDRKEFGLNWNKALEAGGVLVGDEVEITLELEGTAKTAAKK